MGAPPPVRAPRESWTLFDILGRAADAFVLGSLWVLASLPVITVLAASSALDTVTTGWRAERPTPVWATFWTAYRFALMPAVKAQLVLTIPLVVGFIDLTYVAANGLAPPTGVLALGVGVLACAGAGSLAVVIPTLIRLHTEGVGDPNVSSGSAKLATRTLFRDAAIIAAASPLRMTGAHTGLAVSGYLVVLMPACLPLVVPILGAAVSRLVRASIRSTGNSGFTVSGSGGHARLNASGQHAR